MHIIFFRKARILVSYCELELETKAKYRNDSHLKVKIQQLTARILMQI